VSFAYMRLVAQCEAEGVTPPSPAEFTRVDCSVLPSKTVQDEKDACDINKIVERFDRTGLVTHLAKGVPRMLDVSELGDFKSTADKVIAVEKWFEGLPAKVRQAFQNDARVMLERVNDPASRELFEALDLKVLTDKGEAPAAPPPPAQ